MAYHDPLPGSLKRKRRRRPERPPISAKLQLVDVLAGNEAELSDDLVDDLFPHARDSLDQLYIAVSAWIPRTTDPATTSQWTIIPCKRATSLAPTQSHSSIRLPLRAQCAQVIAQNLSLSLPSRQYGPPPTVEIRVADVVPLPLETVYVSLDIESILSGNQEQQRYGNGMKRNQVYGRKGKGLQTDTDAVKDVKKIKDDLTLLARDALKSRSMVYAGDNISLSPSSGTPYAARPSGLVTACEPVAQGTITSDTRIVILSEQEHSKVKPRPSQTFRVPSYQVQTPLGELEEDTSNDAFYTAAEDGNVSSAPGTPLKKVTISDPSDASEAEEEQGTDLDLSGDEEDLISLTGPSLGSQTSGIMSTLTAATPRPFGYKASGVQTPGSVYSSMTSATIRGGQSTRSKVLKTQGLLQRISSALLHPRPSAGEDEEARVYVDTNVLARLGCFSGDWVELAKAADPALTGIASLAMSSFSNQDGTSTAEVRAAKVYGLPEMLSPRTARYPLHNKSARRDSISSVQPGQNTTPAIFLSPLLLTNLGNPTFLCITQMPPPENELPNMRLKGKMPSSNLPPKAKEASLVKLQTPISVERSLDLNALNGLRTYFEARQRIVKSGDLVAIPIDEELGRAVFEGVTADDDGQGNEILSDLGKTAAQAEQHARSVGVAWFRIANVISPASDDRETPDAWNGLVVIDPSSTHMKQSGTEQRNLPPAMTNPWPYYEGMLQAPTMTVGNKPSGPLKAPALPVSQLQRRLRELLSAATSARAVHLGLPPVAILLHSTQRNIGKTYTARQACFDLGLHAYPIDAYDVLTEAASGGGDVKTGGLFGARADRALSCGAQHTCIVIRHVEAFSSDRMFTSIKDVLAESRILIATTTEIDKVPDNLRGLFTHELEMSAPDEGEREAILRSIITNTSVPVSSAVDLSAIAVKTAALVAGDLMDVVDRAIAARVQRLENLALTISQSTNTAVTIRDIQLSGGDAALSLIPSDFEAAVDEARKNFADSIGAPKIPNVQWSDVGGLANVKDAVMETIQLPLSRPELFAKGLKKRSGILFYGPPGTGKTLLAKAIATEFSLNFFSVKGPELLNMYIGESEANVRRVFQRARDARPCVVFFDELDSVAPKRGNQGDSGGVMDRIVSQLLAELDGMSDGDSEDGGGSGVFVIGATNRPDLLDQALLRPGRFDKMLYLGVSDTHDKQEKILQALTRKFTLSPSLNLGAIAATLPFNYTGADLYALCSDSMLKAITRSARLVDSRVSEINTTRSQMTPPKPAITIAQFFDHHAQPADTKVQVEQEDFVEAQRELVPSVSADELNHYDRVRRDFEGNDTKPQAQTQPVQPQPQSAASQPPSNDASQEEIEAWQAAQIEAIMARGFADGSLARNNPKDKDKGKKPVLPLTAPAASASPTASLQPPSADASQEEIEAWQAAQIEAIMARGFADGSLARNDPKGKGKGKGKAPVGYGRENGGGFDGVVAGTAGMNLNGNGNGSYGDQEGYVGKGKGKQRAVNGDDGREGFGNAAQDDDLY